VERRISDVLDALRHALKARGLEDDGRFGESWFVGELGDGWAYTMALRVQNGRWVVAELRVFPTSMAAQLDVPHSLSDPLDLGNDIPARGLTARQLRRIPFGAPLGMMQGLLKAAKAIAGVYRKQMNRDNALLTVAATYAQCLAAKSMHPTADCAEQLRLTVSRTRDLLHRARKAKLLTASAGQGVAGGELTPYAKGLLAIKKSVHVTGKESKANKLEKSKTSAPEAFRRDRRRARQEIAHGKATTRKKPTT
jgi:hypothetical protein